MSGLKDSEELKQEALARMRLLKLDEQVIEDFKNNDKIHITKINNDTTEVTYKDEITQLVEFVEQNKTLKIYHVITTDNKLYILCVHSHKDVWKSERTELKHGFVEAIIYEINNNGLGDHLIKHIGIETENGKITKVVT